jgi:hypothetical protein
MKRKAASRYRCRWLLLASCIAWPGRGQATQDSPEWAPIGWTEDSAYFVYAPVQDVVSIGDDGPKMSPQVLMVVSARSGAVAQYGADAYQRFVRQHPIADPSVTGQGKLPADRPGLSSPDGDTEALFSVDDSPWYPGSHGAMPGATVRCQLRRGDDTSEPCRFAVPALVGSRARSRPPPPLPGRQAMSRPDPEGAVVGEVIPFAAWSPDGRRIAWFFRIEQGELIGYVPRVHPKYYLRGRDAKAAITPVAGPHIQIVSNNSKTIERCVAALEQAGFAPTRRGARGKARTKTVVYAAEGHQGEAERVAAAVPGGASVAPLTWKSAFDLVVVLGSRIPAP